MGKNKRIEGPEMNSPRASTSSSSPSASTSANGNGMTMSILSQRKRQAPDKNGRGGMEAAKKLRRDSNSNSAPAPNSDVEFLYEIETQKPHPSHKLPSEMLLKILSNLDFQSLLHCRLMSKNWMKLATDVCRSRSDLELLFSCYKDQGKLMIEHRQRGMILSDFVEEFGSSTHFPFARYHFEGVTWELFRKKEWTKFLSIFGNQNQNRKKKRSQEQNEDEDQGNITTNIKSLKLTSKSSWKNNGMLKLLERLRDLLLNQLPKLQEFGLHVSQCDRMPSQNSTKVRLFPQSTGTPESLDLDFLNETSNLVSVSIAKEEQRPHLKVLYLDDIMVSSFPGIVTDLLLAAVKLQRIEPFKLKNDLLSGVENFRKKKNFRLLQSLGKLGCLQSAEIHLTTDFLSKVSGKNKNKNKRNSCSNDETADPLLFKLRILDLYTRFTHKNPTAWTTATIYLSNLFESSKNTLRELSMDPVGYLNELPLPQFTKLSSLCVGSRDTHKIKESIFPPGIELTFIFPLLNSLNLGVAWTTAFPHEDFISPIPNLRTLKIIGNELDDTAIFQISQLCPDLKNFCIDDGAKGALKNFPQVGTAIWTHLTKLQSLEFGIDVHGRANPFPAIDSCITGISEENFERLHDCIEADRLLKKWGIEGRVSPSEMAAERTNPSILDLKDLKNLRIRLVTRHSTVAAENLLNKAVTSISEENAFKLMDNFSYEIQRIHS